LIVCLSAVEDLICGTPLNSTEFLQKILSSNLTALLQKVGIVIIVDQAKGSLNHSFFLQDTGSLIIYKVNRWDFSFYHELHWWHKKSLKIPKG